MLAKPVATLPGDIPFAASRWTLVARAADADPARALWRLRGLRRQCRAPVHACLRRGGNAPPAAADLAAERAGLLAALR